MATPLDMPVRRPIAVPSLVVWTSRTGDEPLPEIWHCPGSTGEISSSSCRRVYGDRCFCW
jgi:hypothetical protein